jgi:hypothetical protein
MRTLVALENANCTRCHNAMLRALRERTRVQRVWSDFSTGRLVIEHEDDPDALVSLIMSTGRAVALGGNGEKVMVSLDGHEATQCPATRDTDRAGLGEKRLEMTSPTSPPEAAGAVSAVRSPSGTWSSAATSPSAALSDPAGRLGGGGRAGVRVLSRERPAPGLVLRAFGSSYGCSGSSSDRPRGADDDRARRRDHRARGPAPHTNEANDYWTSRVPNRRCSGGPESGRTHR